MRAPFSPDRELRERLIAEGALVPAKHVRKRREPVSTAPCLRIDLRGEREATRAISAQEQADALLMPLPPHCDDMYALVQGYAHLTPPERKRRR